MFAICNWQIFAAQLVRKYVMCVVLLLLGWVGHRLVSVQELQERLRGADPRAAGGPARAAAQPGLLARLLLVRLQLVSSAKIARWGVSGVWLDAAPFWRYSVPRMYFKATMNCAVRVRTGLNIIFQNYQCMYTRVTHRHTPYFSAWQKTTSTDPSTKRCWITCSSSATHVTTSTSQRGTRRCSRRSLTRRHWPLPRRRHLEYSADVIGDDNNGWYVRSIQGQLRFLWGDVVCMSCTLLCITTATCMIWLGVDILMFSQIQCGV